MQRHGLSWDGVQERLGVVLEKEDEMDCLVAGCNFLLKAIKYEAFAYEDNQPRFIPTQGGFCDPPPCPFIGPVVNSCGYCHAAICCIPLSDPIRGSLHCRSKPLVSCTCHASTLSSPAQTP